MPGKGYLPSTRLSYLGILFRIRFHMKFIITRFSKLNFLADELLNTFKILCKMVMIIGGGKWVGNKR